MDEESNLERLDNNNYFRGKECCLFVFPQTVIEATAPPSSSEATARLFNEQLDSDDAPLKTINEMLSDHFKRLSEVTANSAYGAVAQTIDEYSTVVGQSIERGTDVLSQHADRH